MKKAVIYLMVVCCLLLSACGSSSVVTQEGLHSCVSNNRFNDYNEYIEFYSSAKGLHKDFITWDKMSYFGEVDYFVHDSIDPEYYWYRYYYRDSADRIYNIEVYHTHTYSESVKNRTVLEIPEDAQSMISPCEYDAGYLIKRDNVNNVIYFYQPTGMLYGIDWDVNGIHYALSLDDNTTWTEMSEIPFVAGLLSTDDAEFKAAFKELKQALTAK